MEDIKQMISRLEKGVKNPSRYAQVAPGSFMRWTNKVELQKVFDLYYETIKEQSRQIELLKKEKEEVKNGA